MSAGRNNGVEAALLDQIADLARRKLGLDCSAYPMRVRARLAIGARRYGDEAFLDRDNIRELLEETPDVAAYAVLELQRLGRGRRLTTQVRDDLLRAAVMGAAADFYARRARRRLDDSKRAR